MSIRKTRDLPPRLVALRRRFEHWRGTHQARSRIPELLWGSAVNMAGTYGLNRTAKTLGLDYYSLKRRVSRIGIAVADSAKEDATATFLELAPLSSAGACECTLDLEDATGSKMRVHVKGTTTPDLAALSRSFWNPGP